MNYKKFLVLVGFIATGAYLLFGGEILMYVAGVGLIVIGFLNFVGKD